MATKASAFCDNLLTLIYFHLLPLSEIFSTRSWRLTTTTTTKDKRDRQGLITEVIWKENRHFKKLKKKKKTNQFNKYQKVISARKEIS